MFRGERLGRVGWGWFGKTYIIRPLFRLDIVLGNDVAVAKLIIQTSDKTFISFGMSRASQQTCHQLG